MVDIIHRVGIKAAVSARARRCVLRCVLSTHLITCPSDRSGTRFFGSFASSAPISASDKPTFCANTMKAMRRISARGYRRCPALVRSDWMRPCFS
jgi:hypothetical protein